jgi:hypothetical protein
VDDEETVVPPATTSPVLDLVEAAPRQADPGTTQPQAHTEVVGDQQRRACVEQRGQVGDADVQALRAAGFDDGEIVEILAHVALNLFTNYVNVAFNVPVDFPGVKLLAAA